MTDTAQNGKGSGRRPTDAAKYNNNYDRIFCKKGTQPELTEESTVELLDPYSEGHNWRYEEAVKFVEDHEDEYNGMGIECLDDGSNLYWSNEMRDYIAK